MGLCEDLGFTLRWEPLEDFEQRWDGPYVLGGKRFNTRDEVLLKPLEELGKPAPDWASRDNGIPSALMGAGGMESEDPT